MPAAGSPTDFWPRGGDLGPMAGRGSVRSNAGMFVSDEALLDVSLTAAQARLATSCWFACACVGLHRHASIDDGPPR